MNYLTLLILLALSSCSFKSDKDKNGAVKNTQAISPLTDSDGDLITDLEEKDKGLDPYVANIPKLKINFLQNYNITINYEDETNFRLDTKVQRDNPDFKYRVGNLFLKEHSFNSAAKLGRFSGVSWGKINQHDFSWVKYPEVDKEFYFNKTREFKTFAKSKISSSTITLENTLKLTESPLFESIKDVELNFYYYNFKKEAYVLLHTEKLDRVFQGGIREDFEITINNPPLDLIEDTYFRHGEFIISEVKDFYIPSLKVKYSELLSSVKAKSIAIYKTTPFENDLNYVTVNPKGESFISLMTKLSANKFSITENRLSQIEQFSNNLGDYTYLHEVEKEDKLGKWFIMTNKIKNHYLKHLFTNNDAITLSYLTGSDLAKRSSEKIYSKYSDIKSTDTGKLYALGNITNNSEISLSLYLKELEGVRLSVKEGVFSFSPPRCRNCTGTNWSVHAEYQVNSFSKFQEDWNLNEIKEAISSFDILINNTLLDLNELIEQNHLDLTLKNDGANDYIHLKLKNLHELEIIKAGQENVAFIKIKPLSVGHTGVGVQINKMGGHNIDKVFHAGLVCSQEAARRKIPLAVTSWKFSDWQKNVPWGRPDPRTKYKPTKGELKKYWTGTIVDLISTVTNNYN